MEGASCADLPLFVADKYFNANGQKQPFLARTAKAICSRCVVLEECREEALHMPNAPTSGVIAGVSAVEVHAARRWRAYEQGMTNVLPKRSRPAWLGMTDATNDQERLRLETDPDELAEYADERPVGVVNHPSQLDRRPSTPPRKRRDSKRAPRMEYFSIDVPVPLKGANCAELPRELVDKYFNADVLRQAAAANVAKLVCAHCPVIETCFNRALNGSSVRKSGVIAGMGARELERGRLWLRFERGAAKKAPTSPRPAWLPQIDASKRFETPPAEQREAGDDAFLPKVVVNFTSTKRDDWA